MSARQETFNLLGTYGPGERFSGAELAQRVYMRTHEMHYAASIIRYMRIYRQQTGTHIKNIDKAKSIYEVMG